MSLSKLVGIIGFSSRRWPKRRAPQRSAGHPEIEVMEPYRAAEVGGEWWVLASDGARLLTYGLDETRTTTLGDLRRAKQNQK